MDQPQNNDNSLETFDFRSQKLRVELHSAQPNFIAKDVCDILSLTNTSKALQALDDDEKGITISYTLGGPQKVATVTEPGLYKLIMRSRKPEAHEFQRWVTHTVLPQIRRTGGYIPAAETPAQTMARAVLIAQKTIEQQKAQIEADKPFTVFGRALSVTDDDIQVGQLAKILRQNGYETGPNLLFKQWLKEKVIYRKRTTTNHYEYWPMQACLNAGWFKMKGHSWIGSDGKHESFTLTVTPRGQRHFLNKYLRDMPAMIGKEAQ